MAFRMFVLLTGFIFFLYSTSASAKIEAKYDIEPNYKVIEYKQTLTLQCNFTVDSTSAPQFELKWYRNNVLINSESNDRVNINAGENSMTITRATDVDTGNYSCVFSSDKNTTQRLDFQVISKPYIKLTPSVSVVEGETLTIPCTVFGVPKPDVSWVIGNHTYNETYNQTSGRYILNDINDEDKIASLEIIGVNMDDRNHYTCVASNLASKLFNNTELTTMVRVKDKLAALWPFLGIVAEVVILCTIILIYEKKRNKTELEESDTDGSPEQKNTPDHGKDSDVRQRK